MIKYYIMFKPCLCRNTNLLKMDQGASAVLRFIIKNVCVCVYFRKIINLRFCNAQKNQIKINCLLLE